MRAQYRRSGEIAHSRSDGGKGMRHAERSVFLTPHAKSQSAFDFTGAWKNELGSILVIRVAGSVVTGTFVSKVSDTGGPTPPFDVSGTVTDDLIAFTVNWGDQITSWIGHHVDDNGPKILTLWQIVKAVADDVDPMNQWKMIESGADTFAPA